MDFIFDFDLKFIIAVLNSKFIAYFFDNIRGVGNIDINPEYIKKIPIPNIPKELQEDIIVLANQILTAKKIDTKANTLNLESQIDIMVYRLYGLNHKEIRIIDPDFGMREDEYMQ